VLSSGHDLQSCHTHPQTNAERGTDD
jgi:hypothetical protein